jgi:hypothetical protein
MTIMTIVLKLAYLTINFYYGEGKGFHSTFKKNDSYWYEQISENNYRAISETDSIGYSHNEKFKQSEWAFFPLYPALIKGTQNLLKFDFNSAAFLWSVILSLLGIFLCYFFSISQSYSREVSLFFALLLFSFPFSFYYSMYYSEALFLCLLLGAFISLKHKLFFVFTLLSSLLVLTRPNGFILLLPLWIYFMETKGYQNLIEMLKDLGKKDVTKKTIYFGFPVIAFLAYCYFQYLKTGHFFAFSIAQRGWYRELTWPFLSFFRHGDLSTQINSIYALLVITLSFLLRKKLPLSLNVLMLISILLPLTSGQVTSFTRFTSLMFPLFFAISIYLKNLKYKYFILVPISILHFFTFMLWVWNHPISF